MKIYLFSISLCLLGGACSKSNANVMVIHDCTGDYIRYEQNDYRLCDQSQLDDYADSSFIQADFKLVNDCPPDTGIYCEKLYQHQGHVDISKIY